MKSTIAPYHPINTLILRRVTLTTLMLLTLIYPTCADTLIIQKKDTLIYLLPQKVKEKEFQKKGENSLATFLENTDSSKIINKWLKELLLHSPGGESQRKYDAGSRAAIQKFENKTIALVIIKRLPPFGVSVRDTISHPLTWIESTGNKLRVRTARSVIRNHLTFSSGDLIHTEKLLETERILRNLEWITDARIVVTPSTTQIGLVDVEIIIQDRYPHAVSGRLNKVIPEFSIYTHNLMGEGIYFRQTLAPDARFSDLGFAEELKFNNIYGSRIDMELTYSDMRESKLLEMAVERSFYFNDNIYGGGVIYNRGENSSLSENANLLKTDTGMDFDYQSTWIGRRFSPHAKGPLKKSQLFFTLQHTYSKFHNLDSAMAGHPLLIDNNYYYGGISFGRRDYFKNNMVYSFGRTEDIPYGFLATMSGGINHSSYATRPYVSLRFAMGHAVIPNRGYFYISSGWESYFNKGKVEQGTVVGHIKYITSLLQLDRTMLRIFAEIKYVKGFNRFSQETFNINANRDGLSLFSSKEIRGTEKLVVKLENITFTPIDLWGFKLAFFTFGDVSWINTKSKNLIDSDHLFTSFGGGFKLRNERLVIRTIEFRIGAIMGNPYDTPIEHRFSSDTMKKFDEFLPGAPKTTMFK